MISADQAFKNFDCKEKWRWAQASEGPRVDSGVGWNFYRESQDRVEMLMGKRADGEGES